MQDGALVTVGVFRIIASRSDSSGAFSGAVGGVQTGAPEAAFTASTVFCCCATVTQTARLETARLETARLETAVLETAVRETAV